MAKGDKQDVARAKAARTAKLSKSKTTVKTTPKPGEGRRGTSTIKNTAKLNIDPNAPRGSNAAGGYYGEAYGVITNKEKRRIQLKGSLNAKRSGAAAKATASEKKVTNKFVKEMAKRGANVGSSGSVSARQPSMPVKQGVKNKMKAQGAKAMSGPTSGYGKSTRPRGK
jgi:hypothetical protein